MAIGVAISKQERRSPVIVCALDDVGETLTLTSSMDELGATSEGGSEPWELQATRDSCRGGGGSEPSEPIDVVDFDWPEVVEPLLEAETQETERTSGEVVDALDQFFGLMTATERKFLEELRYLDTNELYREDGARSAADWLVERYRISRERAAGFVSVATRLPDLPNLSGAYEAGELSIDQLKPLVKVADEESDEFLALEAPGWSEQQCRVVARRLRQIDAREAHQERRQRSLRTFWEDDWLVLYGRIHGDAGMVVEEALRRVADQAPKDTETGHFEPYDARMADALTQIASQSLGSDASGEADAATVVCHVDVLTVAGLDGHAELDGFHQISVETARRLLCDCRFQIVKENESGEAVGLGRITRIVPWWLRRLLHLRDGGCRWPGCPRTAWVDRHHIEHWGDGGPTDPDNLLELCRHHHGCVHEGGWLVEGEPSGEVRFVSPAGRVLASRPTPLRPDIAKRFGLTRRPAAPDTAAAEFRRPGATHPAQGYPSRQPPGEPDDDCSRGER